MFLVLSLGNLIVIMVVAFNRKMRSTTNMYVMNLALSDLIVGCFCTWTHLGRRITVDWPFGPVICKLATFMQGKTVARTS